MKNRPSTHFLLLIFLFALDALAYFTIYRAGVARGYSPSLLLAMRDLALFIPIIMIVVWIARKQRYAGDMTLFTAAVLLFSVGQFMQYRLFTDPEYSADRRSEARDARLAKANTLRQRYVNQYYDPDKKRALFGDPGFNIPIRETSATADDGNYWTFKRIVSSVSTLIPIMAMLGFCAAFVFTKRDDTLLWLQRRSFMIGLLTTAPFAVIAIASSGGKFFGNTTPWEVVKITFLLSYAGILADHYRNLSRTYWGMPPWRFTLPFLLVAVMPVIPFFALSDFGQMLVFFGAYVTLYVVAVKRLPQVTMAIILTAALFGAAIFSAGIYNTAVDVFSDKSDVSAFERVKGVIGRGVPRRIHQRFYLWRSGGVAPNPDEHWWWADEFADAKGLGVSNDEAWYNKYAYQPSQALYGVSDGRALGSGLGRGYPETVPIADSDFIYAAVAEEMGLAGGAVIIAAFVIIVIAGMRVAIEARDMYTKLIAAGITAFFGFQAIVNIGGVIRMLPMTGITLPFVSHGGWSLLTSFFTLGMLMAISHRNNSVVGA
ncbi:MAG TPA: FtsW/RodA/SpoVE family cell cycle protein [Blastocatellia bacterium]|jgi:cell division protein FtsW (lipid II flippase)|nr:FtsW/RodA/SpoVE family cell cycle protein [Blastocatellia bacterium]